MYYLFIQKHIYKISLNIFPIELLELVHKIPIQDFDFQIQTIYLITNFLMDVMM
jgi:hypothetical protein